MRAFDERIAIVGLGGALPGAADLDEFWDNVARARDLSSDPPPGRWAIPPTRLVDQRPATPDRVPNVRGYYLPTFAPDLAGLDLDDWPIADLDPVFQLALHIGNLAWRSAQTGMLERQRCGVVLGNIALPIETANARTLEILGPRLGLFHPDSRTNPLNRYSTGLPAALVACGLRLGLGGYALDAACASSLYAVKLACDELLAGRADAMIAGGLVRPDSLYTQMGFAQLRALSPTGCCAPFDARANGLIVGEGGCAFVLKRLADALAHGDTIHAVIVGIGLSNDIEGNVLQPASEGQVRALQAAYRQAGWRPHDVQFIECHATGTPTGDAIEVESLRRAWSGLSGRAVLSGVKSTVGHLLTGAGAASLAKVVLAMRQRTLAPTANFEHPAPALHLDNGPFRVLRAAEPWEPTGPRRAAINGFGFGGINAHVLVEEWTGIDTDAATVTSGFDSRTLRAADPTPIAVVGVASRTGTPIVTLELPVARFRIPPRELEEMLPQQSLMLAVAADARSDARSNAASSLTMGVYIGVSLDPNTTNYQLRWQAEALDATVLDDIHPALTANRTMGALASIAASRVARFLGAGGPSFAVCDEEAGGLRALALAVSALRQNEITSALVGAVEFASDPRCGGTTDGAAAIVLKKLADAERDGERIYAVIDDVAAGNVPNVAPPACGVASGMLDFVAACRALHHERTTINGKPAYWIHDQTDWPRRTVVSTGNVARFGLTAHLREESASNAAPSLLPEDARSVVLLTLASPTVDGLLQQLQALRTEVNGSPRFAAGRWQQTSAGDVCRLAIVASTPEELPPLVAQAERHLRARPNERCGNGVYYAPRPLGQRVAFVYPGSGNHFPDMGRELALAFPQVLRRQMSENQRLRGQYHADEVWGNVSLEQLTPRALIFAQVALSTFVSDLLGSFGIKPEAVVPYSLGESAGLYGTRAWRQRDEMFRRMEASPLFATELAGPCLAAQRHWGLSADQRVDWLTGVISAPAESVRAALGPNARAYVQIINTRDDCVIGGERGAVEAVVRQLGASFIDVRGVSTAHCPVVESVRVAYRALHVLPTYPPAGVRYYSGAWGRAYDLTEESAADAITAAALDTIDFPRCVEAAYADGARIFVEIGPGASCSRMIGAILGARPHVAQSACFATPDPVTAFLQLLALLYAEGVPLDLTALGGSAEALPPAVAGPTIKIAVGYQPQPVRRRHEAPAPVPPAPIFVPTPSVEPISLPAELPASPAVVLAATQTATMEAHRAYLRFATALQDQFAQTISVQAHLLQQGVDSDTPVHVWATPPTEIPRALDFNQCLEFARGKVGNVFGPRFAEIDSFPTRVRLPDGPLQLVDRVTEIDGEPLSMTAGRLVTEHRVRDDRWYLDLGRIPACVAIEAGQADLLLSGFLGIDFKTRGLACYRLLDACVTFHRDLPTVGDLIRYDIRIDHFFRQGNTYLFRFRFDGTVNGAPLLTMRDGCAGFFTAEELAAGKGIVHTSLDLQALPGKNPDNWQAPVPLCDEALDENHLSALRRGDLVGAFGPEFARARLRAPLRLPDGMLRLVHRVERIESTGGRYGLGRIRCTADIHPDDWFLTCHFVDDQVMPGTLMYECCLHTLRVLLMRMGWVCENGEATFEPVPGIASKLKCRGQVIATTQLVTYEIAVKEIGFRPEPYVIADALMYADGKPIVDIANLSLRLRGLTRSRLDEIWDDTGPVFTREQVQEFATGSPARAFGERYRPFDAERFIARLPGDPYSFIDRVSRVENCRQWTLAPGGTAEVEYRVPRDTWYFAANRCDIMPYCVLNEIALQACGWMAAYLGSALTSPDDLHFRNLGGNAVQHATVRCDAGLLRTRIKLNKVAPAAGMIILQFDFAVTSDQGPIYSGDTTFGFFTKDALANQVGLKDARLLAAAGPIVNAAIPDAAPFPNPMLRMVDTIAWEALDGGAQRLGAVEGRARVNPGAWFFKAHFFQDPVWPGSLGLESFVQLMKWHARTRWGDPRGGWEALTPGTRHRWAYRGQILPSATEVTIQTYITEVDEGQRLLKADGLLAVDGRIIYQMSDFTVRG